LIDGVIHDGLWDLYNNQVRCCIVIII